jgi:hypothetical protein
MTYTIVATLGDDLEQIIAADFLDTNELQLVADVIVPLFKEVDAYKKLSMSMTASEWEDYESKPGDPDLCFPYPYFIFNNVKHKDLLAYLRLSGIGIRLNLIEVPDAFSRSDTINLLGA